MNVIAVEGRGGTVTEVLSITSLVREKTQAIYQSIADVQARIGGLTFSMIHGGTGVVQRFVITFDDLTSVVQRAESEGGDMKRESWSASRNEVTKIYCCVGQPFEENFHAVQRGLEYATGGTVETMRTIDARDEDGRLEGVASCFAVAYLKGVPHMEPDGPYPHGFRFWDEYEASIIMQQGAVPIRQVYKAQVRPELASRSVPVFRPFLDDDREYCNYCLMMDGGHAETCRYIDKVAMHAPTHVTTREATYVLTQVNMYCARNHARDHARDHAR